MTDQEQQAVLWAAVGYAAGKEGSRQDLGDGASYTVDLRVTGTIEGEVARTRVTGKLCVGHPQEKASSSGPKQAEVLAAVLALIGPRKRAEVLRTLPETYAGLGNRLDVDPLILTAADAMLARMRVKSTVPQRGVVTFNYTRQ